MVDTEIKLADKLVFYHGGGYDGCFWEWNFFVFNSDGEFHNIFSSGRNGISSQNEAIELIEGDDSGVYVYDLTDEKDINEFQSEHNPQHVIHIVDKVNDGEYGELPELWWKCDHCGEKNIEGGHLDNYHGDGGIGIVYENKYCEECLCNGGCRECGEFSTELIESGRDYCEYCFESKAKEYLKDLNEDGGIFLEFDKNNNRWIEIDEPDLTLDDLDGDEPLFRFEVYRTGRIVNYILNGIDEKTALYDLINYLDGDYNKIGTVEKIDAETIEEN